MVASPAVQPLPEQSLLDSDVRSQLAFASNAATTCGAHSVAFQPSRRLDNRIEDRHVIENWELADGTWKFIGVFDGHGAGHEAVEFVLQNLPGRIKRSLESSLGTGDAVISKGSIREILVQCISGIDNCIKDDFLKFFPGGSEEISRMSDEEIKDVINDPETGNTYEEVLRARTGTTVLVTLMDPTNCLHVASLGDCDAVLGSRNTSGVWETQLLSSSHNCQNPAEVRRVKEAHPEEMEAIVGIRTLGLITLTRAVGDMPFKLLPIYTERVFSLATPKFHQNYKVDELLTRNISPPYLSNTAEVVHADLASLASPSPILVMCSDGLLDLYKRRSKDHSIAGVIREWLTNSALQNGRDKNLAVDLLWDALGDIGAVIKMLTQEPSGRRVDDTTVIVVPL